MNQNHILLPISQLKDKAKGALEGNYHKAIPALFCVMIMSLALQMIAQYVASFLVSTALLSNYATSGLDTQQFLNQVQTTEFINAHASTFAIAEYIGASISAVFSNMLQIGLCLIFLKIACAQIFSLRDVFYAFQNSFKKAFCISLIFTLVAQLFELPLNYLAFRIQFGITTENFQLTSLYPGIVACVIGFILYLPIFLCISQSNLLLLDFPDLSATEIIKLSNRIMRGYKWKYLLLQLSFLPLLFLSLLSFRIGDLWLTPYRSVTYVFFFLNLMQIRESSAEVN